MTSSESGDSGGRTRGEEMMALVRHLRAAGQLNTSLILRALLFGNMELFEAALTELSCLPASRVAALVHDRGGTSLNALLAKAGLPKTTFPAFRSALEAGHEVGFVGTVGGATRLRRRMVERVLTQCDTGTGSDALLILLRRFATESAREEARVFCDELADENDRLLADDFVARLSYSAAESDVAEVADDDGYDDDYNYNDLALIPQDLDGHRHLLAA